LIWIEIENNNNNSENFLVRGLKRDLLMDF